jgi:hypothetical protein
VIDFTQIDVNKPQDWMRLGDSLMQKAVADIQTQDEAGLKVLQDDLGDFAAQATLACPVEVLAAINSSNRQVAAALVALTIAKMDLRTARLDAAGAKVSVAAATAKAEAGRLRLEQARKMLDELNGVANELRQFRDQFDAIPKGDVPGRIDKVLEALLEFDSRIRTATA